MLRYRFRRTTMYSESDYSFISSLESDLYNVIQEIRNNRPPLEIRNDLYSAALEHAKNCVKKVHHNVKEGFESRRMLFKESKRYMEISFVTKPLTSDPISFISYILKDHYIQRIQSHINSIGPAIMKLKSNKYIVIILGAFFRPIFSVRLFFQYFPKIREMNESSSDFDALLELMNHFREMHNFNPLAKLSNEQKHDSCKKILNKTVTYESKKASDLFCRLFTDQTYIDLIGDIWTDFSYSIKKGSSNSIFKMKFYREDVEYVYVVDVLHPITKIPSNDISIKPAYSKRNDKNNNHDIYNNHISDQYIVRDIPDKNETIKDKLDEEVEETIKILNDQNKDQNRIDCEKEKQLSSSSVKRSPFENFEPTDSKPYPTIPHLPTHEISPLMEQKRHNSTSSLYVPDQILTKLNHSISHKLSPKRSAWGNLNPLLKDIIPMPKRTEDEEKQNKENEEKNLDEIQSDENSKPELNQNQSKNQADIYESDSSDVFTLQPKPRSNSAIISTNDFRRSPWSALTPSDEHFDERKELMQIPSELRKNQLKHPEVPAPSKMITKPFSARSSLKGWSKLKEALDNASHSPEGSQSSLINSQSEIPQPREKIIKKASNAWSLINPDLKYHHQNVENNNNNEGDVKKYENTEKTDNKHENDEDKLDSDEIRAEEIENDNLASEVPLSPIAKVEDTENKDNSKIDHLWANEDQSHESTESNNDESNDSVIKSSSFDKSGESKKSSPPLIKKSKKASISTLGQSLKKTGLNTLKRKQPIKELPSNDKSSIHLSPTHDDQSK